MASAAFLLAHGLIHAAFLSRPPAPTPGAPVWPFNLQDTWLGDRLAIGADRRRSIGVVLVIVTVIAFGLAALVAVGVGPADLWPASIGVATVTSITLLGAWFHRWLALGISIDIGLVVAVMVIGWVPS